MGENTCKQNNEQGLNFQNIQMAYIAQYLRSEERRVGKECRSRWSPYH